MATNDYWDYNGTSASTWRTTSTNASTNYDTSLTGCGWSSSSLYYPIPVTRKILVENPKSWTKEQGLKFVELLNVKTKTGFTVILLIEGNVLITDPDVEKRTMLDFIPLLRKRANDGDLQLINEFFENNPCDEKNI
jgi:hypothetical protein